MSCFFPLTAYRDSDKSMHFLKGDADDKFVYNSWLREMKSRFGYGGDVLKIPCGQCLGCRIDKSREWANRCMDEAKFTQNNWFITITYDNEHLRYNTIQEANSGVCVKVPTLFPPDLKQFFDKLRERLRRKGFTDFRYYACGEYGEQYERPHYHAVCFNLPLNDLEFYKVKQGYIYYNSPFLQSVWSEVDEYGEVKTKGYIVVTEVTWETCAYTARYILKKQTGKGSTEYYSDKGVLPEFVRMSRRPGIGRKFYELNKDKIYQYDCTGYNNRIPVKPAKYYDKLFDLEDHDRLEVIKEKRKERADNRIMLDLSQTSLSLSEYYGVKFREKLDKVKLLKRVLDDI